MGWEERDMDVRGRGGFLKGGQHDWEGYFRGWMGYIWCDVNGNAKQVLLLLSLTATDT